MNKKILLACYEVPGWGGASTTHYNLFERMQTDGLDVAYVNLVNVKYENRFRKLFGHEVGNPRALDNVHNCVVEEPLWQPHSSLADVIEAENPELILAFGCIAAHLVKLAAPHRTVVFMTSGSEEAKKLIVTGAFRDFQSFQQSDLRGLSFPIPSSSPEKQAAQACELIIVHSPLIRTAFEIFYPHQIEKIYSNNISVADVVYAEADRFHYLKKPFERRDIEVVFAASDWSRPEKNYSMLRRIASRCAGRTIHVIGDCDAPTEHVIQHGVIAVREELYSLLGRSKILVCPSSFDAAPGVLFEASAMGCNVIASRNCGNWDLCNDDLVANRYSALEFANKINAALSKFHTDNRHRFCGGYLDLTETLCVF
ncbi:MAG: glycosyltransferase [Pirellulales bacterium]